MLPKNLLCFHLHFCGMISWQSKGTKIKQKYLWLVFSYCWPYVLNACVMTLLVTWLLQKNAKTFSMIIAAQVKKNLLDLEKVFLVKLQVDWGWNESLSLYFNVRGVIPVMTWPWHDPIVHWKCRVITYCRF